MNELILERDVKMNVLYVTIRPPYPPYKGDQLISYNQIKKLKNKCKLNLITFIESEEDKERVLNELENYCENIFFIKLSRNKIINILRTIINFNPFQVNMFTESRIKLKIQNIISDIKPDLIHIQTIRIAEYFLDYNLPKVIDMIDAMSLNMKRRAKKENILVKIPFLLEMYLCKKYEEKIFNEYDNVLLVSKKDKEYLNNSKLIVNPNGTYVNEDYLTKYKKISKEKALVFHGNMQYFPNVNAVEYFSEKIFPELREEYKGLKFYIVGKDPVNKIRRLNKKEGIIVTGFVDDVCKYLAKGLIGVYPLKSGTGMQNKILEALACGLPSVVSPLALQGIENINKSHVCIAKNKNDFIRKVIYLIENKKDRERIAHNGQKFIFENYSWDSNVRTLIQTWQKTLEDNSKI